MSVIHSDRAPYQLIEPIEFSILKKLHGIIKLSKTDCFAKRAPDSHPAIPIKTKLNNYQRLHQIQYR